MISISQDTIKRLSSGFEVSSPGAFQSHKTRLKGHDLGFGVDAISGISISQDTIKRSTPRTRARPEIVISISQDTIKRIGSGRNCGPFRGISISQDTIKRKMLKIENPTRKRISISQDTIKSRDNFLAKEEEIIFQSHKTRLKANFGEGKSGDGAHFNLTRHD